MVHKKWLAGAIFGAFLAAAATGAQVEASPLEQAVQPTKSEVVTLVSSQDDRRGQLGSKWDNDRRVQEQKDSAKWDKDDKKQIDKDKNKKDRDRWDKDRRDHKSPKHDRFDPNGKKSDKFDKHGKTHSPRPHDGKKHHPRPGHRHQPQHR